MQRPVLVAARIAADQPALAAALRSLIESYRFDAIPRALDAAPESVPSP